MKIAAATGTRKRSATQQYRVAADICGTYADIALIRNDGRSFNSRLPSTLNDFSDGLINGIRKATKKHAIDSGAITQVRYGCTVATNATLESRGARTALATIKGLVDIRVAIVAAGMNYSREVPAQ